jgi:hypothetical protein
MKIRIIYDYDLTKLINQYKLIQNLFPEHELLVYDNYKQGYLKELVDINIFIDTINETILYSTPSKINILIVNDEYVIQNKYVRREFYYDKPLILIDDVIHYYFCLTEYSHNVLLKNKINKKKLYLLNGLVDSSLVKSINLNNNQLKNNNNREESKVTNKDRNTNKDKNNEQIYIYYEIDKYSEQSNIIILEVWLKYFLNLPIKLIIKYVHEKENIITLFKEKINVHKLFENNIYYYKNIIIFKSNKYLNKYNKNIKLVILNHSNFNILYKLYINILNEKYIITINNGITKDLLHKSQLYEEFNEKNIHEILTNYLKLNDDKKLSIINNNKKQLEKNINKTSDKLVEFFSSKLL